MLLAQFAVFLGSAVFFACCLTPANEQDSLVALNQALSGANWERQWNLSEPPCSWTGVHCTASESIESITLPSNNLAGALPELDLPELLSL